MQVESSPRSDSWQADKEKKFSPRFRNKHFRWFFFFHRDSETGSPWKKFFSRRLLSQLSVKKNFHRDFETGSGEKKISRRLIADFADFGNFPWNQKINLSWSLMLGFAWKLDLMTRSVSLSWGAIFKEIRALGFKINGFFDFCPFCSPSKTGTSRKNFIHRDFWANFRWNFFFHRDSETGTLWKNYFHRAFETGSFGEIFFSPRFRNRLFRWIFFFTREPVMSLHKREYMELILLALAKQPVARLVKWLKSHGAVFRIFSEYRFRPYQFFMQQQQLQLLGRQR